MCLSVVQPRPSLTPGSMLPPLGVAQPGPLNTSCSCVKAYPQDEACAILVCRSASSLAMCLSTQPIIMERPVWRAPLSAWRRTLWAAITSTCCTQQASKMFFRHAKAAIPAQLCHRRHRLRLISSLRHLPQRLAQTLHVDTAPARARGLAACPRLQGLPEIFIDMYRPLQQALSLQSLLCCRAIWHQAAGWQGQCQPQVYLH